jgi:arsenate reductase
MTTLYGIPNCDTVKKARKWLESNGIDYQFHDFRQDGLEAEKVREWLDQVAWDELLNKRSTTWRQLDDKTKNNMSPELAVKEAVSHPTLIKRPVIETSGQLLIGFNEPSYQTTFGQDS